MTLDELQYISWAKAVDGEPLECGACQKVLATPNGYSNGHQTFEIYDTVCFIYDKNDLPIEVMCERCERSWLVA